MTPPPGAASAIVGVGATPYYFRGESHPQTVYELIGKAVFAALADAGLSIDEVDGFAFFAGGFDPGTLTEQLGIRRITFPTSSRVLAAAWPACSTLPP